MYKTHNGLFTIIYIVIAAPMIEELIFRGVMMERCRRDLPLITANIIQALIFGVFHQNMIQGFYTFVAGICLGIVYVKDHSLVSAIIVHIVMNGSGILLNLIMSNINEINMVTLFVFTIIGCLGTALCLMRIIQEDKNKNSENYCNMV